MSTKHTFKWAIILGIIIISGIALGATAYIYMKATEFDQIFAHGIFIDEVPIGGLTREVAKQTLEQAVSEELQNKFLILSHEELAVEIPWQELGISNNIEEVLEEAFVIGHEGNMFEKYKTFTTASETESHFTLSETYDEALIVQKLEEVAKTFYKAPVNATITRKNKQFITTEEIIGEELNVAATKEKVMDALTTKSEGNVEVEVVTNNLEAEYTIDSFKDIQNMVASFSTSYNNLDANRNKNLEIATAKINTMLLPNEIFSLNDYLEPITYEEGYRASKVIVNGKLEEGIGGGVCQVASTLYNTVLLTELDIVMRQNHSLAVAYVPLGRDATYSTGTIDFKFQNNTGHPMFIESYCEDNKVYVNIFAHESIKSDYDIKFESVTTEVIPAPETKYVDDATLEKGKEITETTALEGKRVKLYKLYYKNGVLEKKELVNSSYYRPRAAVIKRGTKEITPTFNPEEVPNSPQEQSEPKIEPGVEESVPMNEWDDSVSFEVIQD